MVEVVKGGLSVDVGVKAFLPGSQVDLRPVKNLATHDRPADPRQGHQAQPPPRQRRALPPRPCSRRSARRRRSTRSTVLAEGMVLTGTVKNITDYGAFIDLGGIDGLLHVTDMAGAASGHPVRDLPGRRPGRGRGAALRPRERPRVARLQAEVVRPVGARRASATRSGTKVTGRVVSLTNYGAFVELEPGVEGLVHVSEMSWTRRVRHPSKLVNVGDEVERHGARGQHARPSASRSA